MINSVLVSCQAELIAVENRSQCAREGTMSERCKSSSGLSLSGPVAKGNCVAVRRGGEQQEVNDQSVG